MRAASIPLTPGEVEQLRLIESHGLTDPGDLISKQNTKSLKSKGLVQRPYDAMVATTIEGDSWLRMAGVIS